MHYQQIGIWYFQHPSSLELSPKLGDTYLYYTSKFLAIASQNLSIQEPDAVFDRSNIALWVLAFSENQKSIYENEEAQ